MTRRAFASAACIALAIAFALAGNAFAGVPGFGAAKAFRKYPVYWAGSRVAGFQLEGINHGGGGFTFFYGSCELSGTDHPSCAPPIEIQEGSTCDRWASELNKVKDLTPFRGAMAIWHPGIPLEGGGEDEAGPLEIFSGRSTIVIFIEPAELEASTDAKQIAFKVARELRTVHQAKPAQMEAPVPGSLTGKLSCQKPPTE